MRSLIAVLMASLIALQPMLSFDDSSNEINVVGFSSKSISEEVNWWEDTRMDRDKNYRHDILDMALEQGKFVVDGKISVLVDFDHMPTESDETLLIEEVGFIPSWRFHHIPIISGDVAPTLTEVEPPAGMDLDQVDWLLNRTFQPSIKSS